MYDTQMYYTVRGTFAEKRAAVKKMSRVQLEDTLIDETYNRFLSEYADYEKDDADLHGHGKRIPYIGWFWRFVQFTRPNGIPIGDCGDFIGFMENNKWDYPSRYLTADETAQLLGIIDEAIALSRKGGNLAEIINTTHAQVDKIWEFMQTLTIDQAT